ncbi:MAG: hypothetical protein L0G69_16635 [Brevibacterium sp.]|nr:hypothetical protein [Brevibacterium sp.]
MPTVPAHRATAARRLRIRIIGLGPRQLVEAGPNSPADGSDPLSRRDTIAEALVEFSSIGSGARRVPDLGDQSLADQVVVLIEDGLTLAENLPVEQRQERIAQLLDAATRLRRSLA